MSNSLKCPYCNGNAELHLSSAFIYNGRDFGPVHACENFPLCDSFVGCHPGQTTPLGRLANSELRFWKKQAHKYFDVLWKEKKIKTVFDKFIPDTTYRKKSYIWLSIQLGLKIDDTHIGMFDVPTCKKVVEICKPYSNE